MDLISRQAAINAIRKDVMGGLNYESILKSLPSAEPERKKGKWIVSILPKGKLIYCSECEFGKKIADKRTYHFCPNCGAPMERGNENG